MNIQDEMIARFNKTENMDVKDSLSIELDFFFDNVIDTVVNYFKEEVAV